MTKLPATTIVCEIVSRDGSAAWTDASAGTGFRAFQCTPPATFGDWMPGNVPVSVNHDGPVIGHLDYFEYGLGYGNGGLFGVGVVEGVPADYIDGKVMCSAEIRCNALAHTIDTVEHEPYRPYSFTGAKPTQYRMRRSSTTVGTMTATDSHLDGVALVDQTASITSTRCRAVDGDYRDHIHRGSWPQRGIPPIVNRAVKAGTLDLRYRSSRPERLPIHHPADHEPELEYRKASRLEVRHALRTIDLIAAPYNEPTDVLIRGRWVTETIAPGAFTGVHGDVTVNRAHNLEQPLGRVEALHPEDPRGLRAELRISRTRDGDDVLELAADGLLAASVGFAVPSGGERWAPDQRSRTVTRAKLVHIALTGDPAYKGAKVLAVRSS